MTPFSVVSNYGYYAPFGSLDRRVPFIISDSPLYDFLSIAISASEHGKIQKIKEQLPPRQTAPSGPFNYHSIKRD
jgi:hypothetical protein